VPIPSRKRWGGRQTDLAVWTAISLFLWLVLRAGYPQPFHETDTASYLQVAREGTFNPYRPVGYSLFLRMLHAIRPGVGTIVFGQFWLHALAVLGLYFSAVKVAGGRSPLGLRLALLVLLALPSLLYCTNYLMSDSLFVSLTLLWGAALLQYLASRRIGWLLTGLFLAALGTQVRYAGLVSVAAGGLVLPFLVTGRRRRILTFAAHAGLCLAIVVSGRENFRRHVGVSVFSPFAQWARANNASVLIPYIRHDPHKPTDPLLALLHEYYLRHPDSIFSIESVLATYPMWVETFPAKKYVLTIMEEEKTGYVQAWVRAGGRLGRYGDWLIRTHPLLYARRFLLPNARELFRSFDPLEQRELNLDDATRAWLRVSGPVRQAWGGPLRPAWGVEKLLKALLWAGVLVGFVVARRRSLWRSSTEGRAWTLLGSYVVSYCLFCVVSHPASSFRYLLPVHAFLLVMLGWFGETFSRRG
jgi:hypothetical protein